MYISKRKKIEKNAGAVAALFVVLSALFSVNGLAQIPVQIQASNTGLHASDLSMAEVASTEEYEATDFTFELSDLAVINTNNHNSHVIKCQKNTDLDFGRAFSGVSAGTVVMDPNTNIARKSTGGVILDNRNIGHPAFIQLTIYNDDHCNSHDHCSNDDNECGRSEDDDNKTNDTRTGFSRHGVWNTISLPSSSTLSLTLGGHTYTMTADNYKFIRTNGNFYIGATLHVGANQVSGVYTGSFSVTQTCD